MSSPQQWDELLHRLPAALGAEGRRLVVERARLVGVTTTRSAIDCLREDVERLNGLAARGEPLVLLTVRPPEEWL